MTKEQLKKFFWYGLKAYEDTGKPEERLLELLDECYEMGYYNGVADTDDYD